MIVKELRVLLAHCSLCNQRLIFTDDGTCPYDSSLRMGPSASALQYVFFLITPYPFCRVQIYRKVTSQILPSALDRVQNVRARDFIRCCLSPDPDERPSAMDLLNLPFLKDKNEDEVRTRPRTGCFVFLTSEFSFGIRCQMAYMPVSRPLGYRTLMNQMVPVH